MFSVKLAWYQIFSVSLPFGPHLGGNDAGQGGPWSILVPFQTYGRIFSVDFFANLVPHLYSLYVEAVRQRVGVKVYKFISHLNIYRSWEK